MKLHFGISALFSGNSQSFCFTWVINEKNLLPIMAYSNLRKMHAS